MQGLSTHLKMESSGLRQYDNSDGFGSLRCHKVLHIYAGLDQNEYILHCQTSRCSCMGLRVSSG